MQKPPPSAGHRTSAAEFVADCIRTAASRRAQLIESNLALRDEPLDLVDLLELDESKLRAWSSEARAEAADKVKTLKTRARHWQAGSVPKHRLVYPLDKRPDSKSLPICLSTPSAVSFSEDVNGTADLANASMDFDYSSSGVGGWLGLEPDPPNLTQSASLWYELDPPAGGTLVVLAALNFYAYLESTRFSSSSFIRYLLKKPALLPGAYSRVSIDLVLRIHQQGPFVVQTARFPVIQRDASTNWIATEVYLLLRDTYSGVISAQIAPDQPVAIEIGLEFQAIGHSDFCSAGLSFEAPGVAVEAMCLNIHPADVVL